MVTEKRGEQMEEVRSEKGKQVISSRVGCQGVFNPVEELTQFDVDARVVR